VGYRAGVGKVPVECSLLNVGSWPMADYTRPDRNRSGYWDAAVIRKRMGRRNHTEDWGRHGAHCLPNATQMQDSVSP
jgi:hypothetical protein